MSGMTVRGLVGAMDLTRRAPTPAQSCVIPHEGLHPEQAQELALRMAEMETNPAPILLLHRGGADASQLLADTLSKPPDVSYTDSAGESQRLWAIRDQDVLDRLDAHIAAATALLADGHHRFAAYLDLQERFSGTGWDRGLTMLIDQDDTPLHLGAIHRVLTGVEIDEVARVLADLGLSAQAMNRSDALERLGHATPVAAAGDDWRVLNLRIGPTELAACHLHDRVIPALPPSARQIEYHHTVQQALDATAEGGTAILMPAPEFDVVLSQSTAGRLLPEKTTSFQPKPSLGVLMRSPDDG